MATTAQDLQRLLEDAWDNAPPDGDTLREELRRNERSVGALIQHGSLSSLSKNSASQSYAFGSSATLTTADMARAWRDLIICFDGARAALIGAGTSHYSETSLIPADAQFDGNGFYDVGIVAGKTYRIDLSTHDDDLDVVFYNGADNSAPIISGTTFVALTNNLHAEISGASVPITSGVFELITGNPTDQQVYEEMNARLQPVYGQSLDMSTLR